MPASILILSSDKDFCEVLSEQLHTQFRYKSQAVSQEVEAKQQVTGHTLLLCDGETEHDWPCPVIRVDKKPLRLQDLLAEIALLVHKATSPDVLALAGDIQLDGRLRQLVHIPSGRKADVTDKEMQLLMSLTQAGMDGRSRNSLLKEVWGFDAEIDTHTLETHIYRLRGKLKEVAGIDGMIEAVDGGYRMINT